MKSRILVIVFAISVFSGLFCGCYTNQFGSYYEDSKISYLESEINHEKRDVEELKSKLIPDYSVDIKRMEKLSDSLANAITRDTLNERESLRYLYEDNQSHLYELKSAFAAFGNNAKIQDEILKKEKRIKELETFHESIINEYISYNGVPKEITRYEAEARSMANDLRRQEMVLKKVENNLGQSKNDASSEDKGLKIIVENNYGADITFMICPIDGGEQTAVCLASKKMTEINLIPGKYIVSTYAGGRQIGEPRNLSVDGTIRNYKGKACYNFICMSASLY